MHRKLIPLFLLGILKANEGETYTSPGIQIGMNSKGNLFISGQITFGLFIDDTVIGDAVPIGLTLGKMWYKIEKNHGINIIILTSNCGLTTLDGVLV